MYFASCHTAAACKSEYKRLAKELHPDKQGGSSATFQQMQAEYEQRLQELQKDLSLSPEEQTEIAQALLSILRITKPEYYNAIQQTAAMPIAAAVAGALGGFFPERKATFDGILAILK